MKIIEQARLAHRHSRCTCDRGRPGTPCLRGDEHQLQIPAALPVPLRLRVQARPISTNRVLTGATA